TNGKPIRSRIWRQANAGRTSLSTPLRSGRASTRCARTADSGAGRCESPNSSRRQDPEAQMTKKQIEAFQKKLDARMASLAKERDRLAEIADEAQGLADDIDTAIGALEEAKLNLRHA